MAGWPPGFEKIPRSVRLLMIERVVAHGITLTRSSDPWNDYEAAAREIEALKKLGMDVVINIIYSVSPRHTDEYTPTRARQAAAIQPYRICFKDVGGLLTPDRARTLIPLIQQNIGDVPLEFHAHCNNGMAPFNYLEAIKLGVDTLHTAIPPLANGSSQPSIFNIAANARALGFKPLVDLEAIKPVEKHFTTSPSAKATRRRAARIRSRAVSASGARRHDLQLTPSAAHDGYGKSLGGNFGGSGAGARRVRLSDHGDAAGAVRRQPGGDQHDHRRALQRGDRSIDSVRAWALGQRSADGDG